MFNFGLIGDNLPNSFSKSHFSALFRELRLENYHYDNYPIEDINNLSSLLEKIENPIGFNITKPYKKKIIPLLDSIDEESRMIGAVNTIRIHKGKLYGYNTDAFGFEQSLIPILTPVWKAAMVFGNGGAAAAITYVLRKLQIPFIQLSRDASKGMKYDELRSVHFESHSLLVNCTPLGMRPDLNSSPPIPYEFINENHLAYDLVYDPEETLFLKRCREKGASIKNGLEMLYLQAARSWEIWNADSVI